MATTILIAGKTGTGKTTAIRTLDPKETIILKVINRKLPFKYKDQYIDGKNMFHTPTYDKVVEWIDKVDKKGTQFKNLVITDGTYIMRQEFIKRAKENNYNKFTDMAQHLQSILVRIQEARDDLKVFLEFHVEPDESGAAYKASTVGKLIDEKYNVFENVDIILFTSPQYEDKESVYGFYTNHTIDRAGLEVPAKSPMGMFDDLFVPNDLALVSKKIDEYYGD